MRHLPVYFFLNKACRSGRGRCCREQRPSRKRVHTRGPSCTSRAVARRDGLRNSFYNRRPLMPRNGVVPTRHVSNFVFSIAPPFCTYNMRSLMPRNIRPCRLPASVPPPTLPTSCRSYDGAWLSLVLR